MKRAAGARMKRTVDEETAAGSDTAPVIVSGGDGGQNQAGTPEDRPDRFAGMTGKELQAEAKDRNIDLTGIKTVGQLRKLLQELEK